MPLNDPRKTVWNVKANTKYFLFLVQIVLWYLFSINVRTTWVSQLSWNMSENVHGIADNESLPPTSPIGPNGITQAEIDELQEIFNLVDTDRGGSIEPSEVTNLLNTLGIKTTQEEGIC